MTPLAKTPAEHWYELLKQRDRRVLQALQALAINGTVTCSYRELAERSGFARSYVIEAVKRLVELGLISRQCVQQRQFGRAPNSYHLLRVYVEAGGDREEIAAA